MDYQIVLKSDKRLATIVGDSNFELYRRPNLALSLLLCIMSRPTRTRVAACFISGFGGLAVKLSRRPARHLCYK
jgi:hypothetical protein